ncbi:MAG: hypothetical protein QOF99_8887 [Pseudonocardiales bacterium]|nr:hypothetical protein [Pseudonocardiales bacterium]
MSGPLVLALLGRPTDQGEHRKGGAEQGQCDPAAGVVGQRAQLRAHHSADEEGCQVDPVGPGARGRVELVDAVLAEDERGCTAMSISTARARNSIN